MLPLIPVAASLVANYLPDLLKLFGNEKQAKVAEVVVNIAKQVTGKDTPDEAAKAIAADPNLALQFKQAVLNQQTELERIALQRETLYVGDVQDARRYRDSQTFKLAIAVLISFAAIMGLVLYGVYWVITTENKIDNGVFTAVVGLVSAIVGYFSANAQQVVSFFFGSSHGSVSKSDNIADSIKAIGGK